jgi:Family of unknown function (DUF6174)
MRLNRLRLALFVPLLAGACSLSGPTEPERAFDSARRKWQEARLTSYSFKSALSCYCPVEYLGPHTVTVRNGQVTAIVDRRTGEQRPTSYRQPIDSLFAFIELQLRERPDLVEATYDAQYGYPRSLKWGTPANDAGGYSTVDSLVILP